MTYQDPNAVMRRNLLLTFAGVFLVLSSIMGLLEYVLQGPQPMLFGAMVVTACFFASLGCRDFGEIVLPQPVWPWYCRRGSGIYLFLVLPALSWVLTGAGLAGAARFGTQPPKEPSAMFYGIIGLVLMWIVFSEWPSKKASPPSPPPAVDDEPDAPSIPPSKHFGRISRPEDFKRAIDEFESRYHR